MKQKLLAEMFPPNDDLHVSDGFPIPICKLIRRKRCRIFQGEAAVGYCAAKKEYCYGLRGVLVVNSKGRIVCFVALPGKADERASVAWLYAQLSPSFFLMSFQQVSALGTTRLQNLILGLFVKTDSFARTKVIHARTFLLSKHLPSIPE